MIEIFEKGDLCMRSLMLKKNVSEQDDPNTIKPTDKVALYGWLVGFKADDAELYDGAAIIAVNLSDPHKIEGHKYCGYISCEGGIPNPPAKKGYSLILGDEQKVNPFILSRYSLIPEVIEREKQFE